MEQLFEEFRELLNSRIRHHSGFTEFGEDSVRLDFCISLVKTLHIQPYQISLERPIPKGQFTPSPKKKETPSARGRQEDKPEIDLVVDPLDNLANGLVVEFAFFRKSLQAANSPQTKQHAKLMNDILRLSLMKEYKDYRNYQHLMICLSDEEMIDYGATGKRGPKAMPIQKEYNFNEALLKQLLERKTLQFDPRFESMAKTKCIEAKAKLIYHSLTKSEGDISKWVIWIWEVGFEEVSSKKFG